VTKWYKEKIHRLNILYIPIIKEWNKSQKILLNIVSYFYLKKFIVKLVKYTNIYFAKFRPNIQEK